MLTKIVDIQRVNSVRAMAEGFIQQPADISLAYLNTRGWIAVPAEGSAYFVRRNASNVADAARSMHCPTLYAMPLSGPNKAKCVYELDTTMQDLLILGREVFPTAVVLMPAAQSFGILCTPEIQLVTGPAEFVTAALGRAPDLAYKDFLESFVPFTWPPGVRQLVYRVSECYAPTVLHSVLIQEIRKSPFCTHDESGVN
jgi:hypothetical protein